MISKKDAVWGHKGSAGTFPSTTITKTEASDHLATKLELNKNRIPQNSQILRM